MKTNPGSGGMLLLGGGYKGEFTKIAVSFFRWTKEAGEDAEQWTEKLEERNWEALEKVWSTSHSAPGGEVVD